MDNNLDGLVKSVELKYAYLMVDTAFIPKLTLQQKASSILTKR